MLNKEANNDEEQQVHSAAEVYVKEAEATKVQNALDSWEVLEGLPIMQKFPPHILYQLSS